VYAVFVVNVWESCHCLLPCNVVKVYQPTACITCRGLKCAGKKMWCSVSFNNEPLRKSSNYVRLLSTVEKSSWPYGIDSGLVWFQSGRVIDNAGGFVVFRSVSRQIPEYYVNTGHSPFLLHPFQFTFHLSPNRSTVHYVVWDTDSIVSRP
jgi:hypothetical protein